MLKGRMFAFQLGGSGGSFLAGENFGRMFDHSFPACAFLFICLFLFRFCFVFVFEVEISSRTLTPLFELGSVHSGSAS